MQDKLAHTGSKSVTALSEEELAERARVAAAHAAEKAEHERKMAEENK